jgi:hypothetical protein
MREVSRGRTRRPERIRSRRPARGRALPLYDIYAGDEAPEDEDEFGPVDIDEGRDEDETEEPPDFDLRIAPSPRLSRFNPALRRRRPLIGMAHSSAGELVTFVQNYRPSRRLFPSKSQDGRLMAGKAWLAKHIAKLIIDERALTDEGSPVPALTVRDIAGCLAPHRLGREKLETLKSNISKLKQREWVELPSGKAVQLSSFFVQERGRPGTQERQRIIAELFGNPNRSNTEIAMSILGPREPMKRMEAKRRQVARLRRNLLGGGYHAAE